jgi:hypothetical protein
VENGFLGATLAINQFLGFKSDPYRWRGSERKLESFVMDSDRVCQQRQSSTPIKVVLDQDQLKRSFVGLWTPAGSDQSRLLQDLELI